MTHVRLSASSVRYALTHKGACLGKQEISDMLLPDIMLIDETVMLVMRAWEKRPDFQRDFLSGLVLAAIDKSDGLLMSFLKASVAGLPDDCEVRAPELAPLSWCGLELGARFKACVMDCYVEWISPILLGYPAAVGLVSTIRYGAPFYFVLPEWLGAQEHCGYDFPMSPYDHAAHLVPADAIEEKCEVIYFPSRRGEAQAVQSYLENHGRREVTVRSVLERN